MSLEGVEYGRSRADTAPAQLDLLLEFVRETEEIPGDIVEVGSWKCGCSIAMAASTRRKVYAFDTFGGLPYGNGHGFENFSGTSYYEIRTATAPYINLQLVRGMHELTIPKHPKSPISLIYLDSDHYSSHHVTLKTLAPLVSPGGMIVFHDWTFPEVQKAVHAALDLGEFEQWNRENMLDMGALRRKPCSLNKLEG
jgi:cephalosporin hydroxylase